jgi:hypothetical protein
MSGVQAKAARRGLLLALALMPALGGCSIPLGDLSLGNSSDAPRPKDAGGYLPVNQLPPDRDEAAMNPAERAKVQADLVAARERQASAPAAKEQAAGKDQGQGAK